MFKELEPSLQQELIAAFRVELGEKAETISTGLLQLEKGADPVRRGEILEGLFRAAHSIKGAARGIGLEVAADLSHDLESLFATLKKQAAPPSSESMDAALAALDFIKNGFEDHVRGRPLSQAHGKELGERLTALAKPAPETTAEPSPPAETATTATPPTGGGKRPGKRWRPPPVPAPGERKPPEPAPPEPTPGPATAEGPIRDIPVPVEKLDRLNARAEEIHVNHLELRDPLKTTAAIRQRTEEIEHLLRTLPALPEEVRDGIAELRGLCEGLETDLAVSSRQLQRLTHTLRHDLHLLRLVKATTLTRPLPRMVRDLARELGKKVHFSIDGDDLEIDRALLGFVRDPLIHMLRNALDHAIESPERRQTLGKPQEGRLAIRIQRRGNGIHIRVSDDGAGLDPKKIARAARRKGLFSTEELETMETDQLLELIFQPGFSSRNQLTATSGRGVGLDVARANMRAINGRVRVESDPGVGTIFTLELPLTLATERGLLVRCHDRLFAIPTKSVDRIRLVHAAEILRIENREAVSMEGKPVPLARLTNLLALDHSLALTGSQPLPAVLVSNGWQQVALLVDDVVGEREIVIKRLQAPLYEVANVAGAAITGSGQVMIVLEPAELLESALNSRDATVMPETRTEPPPPTRVLVVDDSITTRTLEKNILQGAGFQVRVAVNGQEALRNLREERFDLVVTDVQMPVMDGIELTERIKNDDTLRDIPVIIVSSLGSDSDKQQGVRVGADAYIVKSQFETRALLDMVEELV